MVKNKTDEDEETEKDDRKPKETNDSNERNDVPERMTRRRGASPLILLLGVLVIYIGAVVLNLVPADFLSQLLGWLTNLTRQIGL